MYKRPKMSNCSNHFPTTTVLFHELADDTSFIITVIIGSLLALICLLIYLEELRFLYFSHHSRSSRLTYFIVLLALFPVICILGLIAILVPSSTVLTDLLASGYLSVCIYVFVTMTIDYFGGENNMVEAFTDEKIGLTTPPCCCCCCCILKPIPLTRSALYRIKLLSLQVIVVRPLLLFVGAVLWTDGEYEPKFGLDSSYLYIALFSGISTLLSVYGLIVIFRNSRLKLKHISLTMKFIPVQACVILVNLQHFIFNYLAQRGIPECIGTRGSQVRMAAFSHAVLIVEMLVLSIIARKGFRRLEDQELENVPVETRKVNGIDTSIDKYGSFDNPNCHSSDLTCTSVNN